MRICTSIKALISSLFSVGPHDLKCMECGRVFHEREIGLNGLCQECDRDEAWYQDHEDLACMH